jgi:3-hexulose-6-phosphate synthase
MKLQIAYDFTNLSEAITIAKKTSQFADILEVGTLLIYKEGVKAIEEFKKEFPNKEIFADAKISDRASHAISIFANAGANIISVLAGTANKTILNAAHTAHKHNTKVALDLMDAYSMGQSAMDAEKLGVDCIIFHRSHDVDPEVTLEQWDTTKGNTSLPIFISGKITKENVERILKLKPNGIVIGSAITKAENPEKEAEYFKSLLL